MYKKLKKTIQKKTSNKIQIQIRKLKKSFGSNVVLSDINLDIFKNESLVILGGSGSGKSVLIKCIVGLMKPDSGIIIVNNRNILDLCGAEYEKFMSTFGFLFQAGALFDSLTILENVAFYFIYNKNVPNEKARAIASENLARVGLDNSVLNLYPAQLSGGMQKRVAFARTIAHNPEILFFDEPTTGLDPIMTSVVNDLIIHCRNILKATSITITHDINSVRKIATRIAMLYKGKIVWTGNVKDLDHPKNKIVEQFIHGIVEKI
ncbi:MAG: ATP-binding cassette domain-containing protein [Rickettsiales bacterium]|nr:ATP-binding cassette domain-containing protein [Rickettsiales bacterium]